jgi:20S proteasome subunit beta 3
MVGKDCVAIASDRRFGVQAMTLNTDFKKIFEITPKCFIGLAGIPNSF